jgi:hypothetical protein
MRTPGKRLAMLIPCKLAASRSLPSRPAKPSALAIKAAPERGFSYWVCLLPSCRESHSLPASLFSDLTRASQMQHT